MLGLHERDMEQITDLLNSFLNKCCKFMLQIV